jgi:hypothetical protein
MDDHEHCARCMELEVELADQYRRNDELYAAISRT